TLVELWTCNGGANQQWKAENGELVNPTSGQCLDDPNASTTNGTQLQIWNCSGASNQKWTAP
ncbi:MAG TPA: ricin-type beta-trefoil lectin domain protein, partial [Trebonia sp.]